MDAMKLEGSVGNPLTGSTENNTNGMNGIIDIFGNGKLIKKMIRKAPNKSTKVEMQNIVKVNLTGALSSTGKIIDTREKFEFVSGHGEVIIGVDAAVALMKVGETSEVSIDPAYAFRDIDWYSSPCESSNEKIHIPPNSHLTYLVEVLSVEPYPEASYMSTNVEIDRILHFCNKKRLWGNMWYIYGDYATSSHLYELYQLLSILKVVNNVVSLRAFSILQKLNYSDIERVRKLYIVIGNNLSITKMKMDQHGDVIKILNFIVHHEPHNTKAIYRLAQVGLLDECYEFLIKCRKLGVTNQLIERFYLEVHEKVLLENQKQRESYSRIFQTSDNASNSYITSTLHTFSTPQSSINIDQTAIGGRPRNPSATTIADSPLPRRLLRWSVVGSSVLFLFLSYYIFN